MPTPATIRAMREAIQHHQANRLAEAERIYRSVLQQDSRDADALHLLGLVHHQTGEHEQAVELITRAIAIRPEGPFYVNLSQAQRALGRPREAIESCRLAVQLGPKQPEAWNNLGSLLQTTGRAAEALPALHQAIALNPRYAVAYNNLGNALARLGRAEEGIAALRRAIEIDPNYGAAYINLANQLTIAGKLEESIACCRRAIELGSNVSAAYANLGVALHTQGYFEAGNEAFTRGAELDPNQPRIAENLLAGMHYSTKFSAEQLLGAHVDWARRFADPLTPASPTFANDRSPNRRLRIGYISADLKRHSVAYFLEPILEHHDRGKFEITVYSSTDVEDEVTARLRKLCDRWRDIVPMADDEAAAAIRADGIDVLIDLAGHTVGNRLLVLARKPAPVRMTYLGYPGTTGLRAIDYRITDALADPVGSSESSHTERLLRVSPPFVRYRPPADAPPVVDPPMLARGFVTFGSFNKAAKIGPDTFALWAKVLHSVAGSRLIVKSSGLGEEGSRRRILEGFAAHRIDATRLELIEASQPLAQHLAMYGQIDIALDTFPYHGTTTTCEALWMGVPVLSLSGPAHVSRVGASLLTAIGKPGWCVPLEAEFVSMATQLSGDATALRDARRSLRNEVKSSPLCDYAGFVRELENLYRESFIAWAADKRYI